MKIVIKWIGYTLVAGLLLLVAIFITVNSIDEELNPAIPALLQRLQQPVLENGNAYYSLLGLWRDQPDLKQLPVDQTENENPRTISLQLNGIRLCHSKQSQSCFSMLQKHNAAYQQVFNDNHLLLQRYRRVLDFTFYQEPFPESDYQTKELMKLHQLYLTKQATDWQAGQKNNALTDLVRSHVFWRRVMDADTSLVTRLIAITVLEDNFRLLSDILDRCGDCRTHQSVLKTMLIPFTAKALSQKQTMLREFANLALLLPRANSSHEQDAFFGRNLQGKLLAVLYRPNTLRNNMYKLFSLYADLTDLPLSEYKTKRIELDQQIEKLMNPSWHEQFFNFVENRLLAIAWPSTMYYERNQQLETTRRQLTNRLKEDKGI